MRTFACFLCSLFLLKAMAQFPPHAGMPGSTAVPAESPLIVGWAVAAQLQPGWINVADTSLGRVAFGVAESAIGPSNPLDVVSLGDGGSITLQFAWPIFNGDGWDFAVFENSFSHFFLELAHVEVSSDGLHFFRFPSVSLTDTAVQVGPFDLLDTEKIHNLAGKYKAGFGTPFDLEELSGIPQLNIDAITHVRVVDVVGSMQSEFASRDAQGRKINDPWPTPFTSGGFDLDAVGVRYLTGVNSQPKVPEKAFTLYPNPAQDQLCINPAANGFYTLYGASGLVLAKGVLSEPCMDVSALVPGLYFIHLQDREQNVKPLRWIKQ